MTCIVVEFVITTKDEAPEIKTIIQISERVLFCIALISSLNTEYASVQPEIQHFWLFTNFWAELLPCSGGRLPTPLLEKPSAKF